MLEHAHRYLFGGQGAYLPGYFPVVADPTSGITGSILILTLQPASFNLQAAASLSSG